MITEERAMSMFVEANPVPSRDDVALIPDGGAAYLANLEQRSSEVTQLDTKGQDQKEKKTATPWLVAAAVAIVAGIGLIVVNQGDETPVATQPGPEEVITDYADTRNSGDVDGVMDFYAEDAVYENHALDIFSGVATGAAEIRALEEQIPAVQGPGDGLEIIDMVVSGNTVTFNHRFFYGADGVRSEGSAGCAGVKASQVTVEDGKITLYVGGTQDPSQCLD